MVAACAALFDGAARWPAVDVFAGAGPGEHVVPQFFTEYPGSLLSILWLDRWAPTLLLTDGAMGFRQTRRHGVGVSTSGL